MLDLDEFRKKADAKVEKAKNKLQTLVTLVKNNIELAESKYYDTVHNLMSIQKILDDRKFCSLGNDKRNFHWHADKDKIGMGFYNINGTMYLIVHSDNGTSPLVFGCKNGILMGFSNEEKFVNWIDKTAGFGAKKVSNNGEINDIGKRSNLLTYFLAHIEQFAKEYEEYALSLVND